LLKDYEVCFVMGTMVAVLALLVGFLLFSHHVVQPNFNAAARLRRKGMATLPTERSAADSQYAM
jgi:hypothetical protein